MKPPWYQRMIQWIAYGILGFIALGSFVGAINDANVLITPLISYMATVIIAVLTLAAELILRIKKLPWVSQGALIKFVGLNTKTRYAIVGAIALLWFPRLPDIATKTIYSFQEEQKGYEFSIYLVNERYTKLYVDKLGEFFFIDPANTSNKAYLSKGGIKLSVMRWEDPFSFTNPFSKVFDGIIPIIVNGRNQDEPYHARIKAILLFPRSRAQELNSYLDSGDLTFKIRLQLLDGTVIDKEILNIRQYNFSSNFLTKYGDDFDVQVR